MVTPGHERWHPHPDFYYQPGGGPLLDMGPYYVASLIHLLGPVRRVVAASSRLRPSRVIGTGQRTGVTIPVDVDTHVTGILEHESGALSTLTTSFDGTATTASPIEVHGEGGSLAVPDPNGFDGDVRLIELGDDSWRVVPPTAGLIGATRGAGLLDFVAATSQRPARAGGDMALHSLDVMLRILESAEAGTRLDTRTQVGRPVAVPLTPREAWLG